MLHNMTMVARHLPSSVLYASVHPEDLSGLQFYKRNSFVNDIRHNHETNRVIVMKKIEEEAALPRKRPSKDQPFPTHPPAKKPKTEAHATQTERRPLDVTLKQHYLSLIKNGTKTVEGRIASGMFSKISAGSRIRFYNQTDSVVCRVTRVTKYASFRDMLQGEGVEKCLPGTATVEAGVRIYDAIPRYRERAQHYGVVGIQLHIEGK
jgi:ASC-1-like (ASCH) protein